MVEGPFARLFPSKLQPVEIAHKLERALEDNVMLQGEGRRLGPNVYDVYLSIKDHQQLTPSQSTLIRDWQNQLVEFARHRRYTLKTVPIIRLHSDTSLQPGLVRIETSLSDNNGENGLMATQALSAEQLAQIRAQLPSNQQLPGIDNNVPAADPRGYPNRGGTDRQRAYSGVSNPNYPGYNNNGNSGFDSYNNNMPPASPPTMPASVSLPPAWLTIRLAQAGQEVYHIEKPLINIGRQLSNDIIVEDKRVSRYHAQIKFQPDGQFVIYDLGSTNGITINGTPHMRQHTLRNGDRFTIGSYDFYFERR
jgi:hypothetical protein